MRFNPFKNIRLATQMYAQVGVSLLVATGLILYAMHAVQSTQGTLKYTVGEISRRLRNVSTMPVGVGLPSSMYSEPPLYNTKPML